MTRQQFQDLADLRGEDAAALLTAGRWSAAFYLAGYAVECGLKACVMKQVGVEEGGMLFDDGGFQRERCLTHDLRKLVAGAALEDRQATDFGAAPPLAANWNVVAAGSEPWSEAARYEEWPEAAARRLYDAVTDPSHGVLPWIRRYW